MIAPLLMALRILELSLCHRIESLRKKLPKSLRTVLIAVCSAHLGYDLSCAVWICGLIASIECGARVAWLTVTTGGVSFLMSLLPPLNSSKSPSDVDPGIRARGRVSPAAFPCVELATATAVGYGLLTTHPSSPWAWMSALISVGLLCAHRLLALTHFPSQLAGSVALSLVLCTALDSAAARMLPDPRRGRLPPEVHAIGGTLVGMAVVGYIAALAESNDAPFLRVQKRECE